MMETWIVFDKLVREGLFEDVTFDMEKIKL